MLHFCQTLRGLHHPSQAFVIQLVGRSPSGPSAKHGAHGNSVILFRHILVNRIIRKARERAPAAIEQRFHLVGGGIILNLVEDVSSFGFV